MLRMHTGKQFKSQATMPLNAGVSTDIATPDGKDGPSMRPGNFPWIIRGLSGEGLR